MHISRFISALTLCLAFLTLGGCEDESLVDVGADGDPLFDRYVAIGNSITAGYQSSGINAATQQESYAVLLAEEMGTEFNVPLLETPGCPPPLASALTGERQGGQNAPECALRETPAPQVINNVAVPGSQVIDVLTNSATGMFGSNPNELTTILLGGRTQLEAARDANPTFVSVWTGNNDVLGAALAGDTRLITPPDSFRSRYTRVLDALEDDDVQGGVLIGVADVTLIPHFSPGAAYFQAKQQGALPDSFKVDSSCAPNSAGGRGSSTLISYSYGFQALLSLAREDRSVTLDCADDRTLNEKLGQLPESLQGLADYSILTESEIQLLTSTLMQYNAFIEQQAQQREWAYLNPNDRLQEFKNNGQTPLFPNLDQPQQIFGPYFSLDGVHPSADLHEVIAEETAMAINETYGTNLGESQTVPVEDQ